MTRALSAAVLISLAALLPDVARAQTVFNSRVQVCSGQPYLDVTCTVNAGGADPTGVADSTAALTAAVNAAVTGNFPIYFPAGTYRVASKLTWDYQGAAASGLIVGSDSAVIDGREIPSGNVLQIQCSGGTTATPIVCGNLALQGTLVVKGNTPAYAVAVGKTDFSDRHDAAKVDHLIATNDGAGGALQLNYVTNSDLWLSGTTAGGSSSIGAVALEQVQTSRIGGYGSALGASAPGLLLENGATVGNQFLGFAYDPNGAVCISITSAAAVRNAWLAPYLPCTTAVNATTDANRNALIGPHITATNMGPLSTGVSIIGRGSVHRYSAPAASSQTLFGADDGTIFSAANASGAPNGFAGATLALALPDPVQVGAGWTAAFVSDAGKAITVTPPGAAKILARGQQLSSLTIGAPNQRNYDVAIIESDGATGFRVISISQAAGLLNGLETAFPATWMFPAGPGYTATLADNGEVLSSIQTSSGLALTLPAPTTLPVGWSLGLSQDGGKPITVAVNGGQIMRASVPSGQSSLKTLLDHQVITLYFDGSSFREVTPPPTKRVDATSYGAQCGGTVDATPALQLADDYFSAGGGGGTITVSCPLKLAGTAYLDDFVRLQGEGAVYYRGMLDTAPNGAVQAATWPPAAGPVVNCTGTVSQGMPACFMVRGIGVEVSGINFGNPQPTPPADTSDGGGHLTSVWTPTEYPPIIGTSPAANWNGLHVHHVTFTSASRCIDLEGSTNYGTSGIAGAQWTISDVWGDPCMRYFLREASIDNTGRVSNIDLDWWYGRNNSSVGYWMENNSVGLDLCYAANTQFHNIEFLYNKYAIQFTNCSVVGGFGHTAAGDNLQFDNIDFNLVCQAVAIPQGAATVVNYAIFTNVIAYQDDSWCGGSTLHGHPNPTGAAFFDFSSDNANAKLIGVRAGAVQSFAAIGHGGGGNLEIIGTNVNSYSTWAPGSPAVKISAGAHVTMGCMNDFSAWVPANGNAGTLEGPGDDGSRGFMQPCYVGGGSIPGEGSVVVRGSGDTNSGFAEFYSAPGAPPIGSFAPGPTGRLGYIGNCNSQGCNFAADSAAVYLKPHASDFSGNSPFFKADSTNGTLHLGASGLDSSAPNGACLGQVNIDTAGNLYYRSGVGC